jgi:tetracycline resistance efflux pump
MMTIAAVTHEVIPALFCGIWVASTFVNYYNPLVGLLRAFDTYIPGYICTIYVIKTDHNCSSIQDEDNSAILFFVLLLGGMVGILHDAGAVQALARVASRWATSSKRGNWVFCDCCDNCEKGNMRLCL